MIDATNDWQFKRQVHAFIGTTPNIGTTVSALATAYRIAEITEAKVAYLCLNLKSSKVARYIRLESPHATLDELLPHLRNHSITKEILLNAMATVPSRPNLHFLLGNRQREMSDYFNEEDITLLLSTARAIFDTVIVDCSAYWDNAGSLCGLQLADRITLVTTTALSHFQDDVSNWYNLLSQPLGIVEKEKECIVIRLHKQYRGYSITEIEDELQVKVVGEVMFPMSLYESLDGGNLDHWLTETAEGKSWLIGTVLNMLPHRTRASRVRFHWKWSKIIRKGAK